MRSRLRRRWLEENHRLLVGSTAEEGGTGTVRPLLKFSRHPLGGSHERSLPNQAGKLFYLTGYDPVVHQRRYVFAHKIPDGAACGRGLQWCPILESLHGAEHLNGHDPLRIVEDLR